jgi:hypothetical protein
LAFFTARYPTVVAGITEYFQPDRTVDDLFRDCLQLIIDPAERRSGLGTGMRERAGVSTEELPREPKAPSGTGLRSEEPATNDEGRSRLRGAGGERESRA